MSALAKFFSPPATHGPDLGLEDRVQWLGKVRLFKEIHGDVEAIAHIARITTVQSFPKGTAILAEGAEGAEAYFLIEGTVKVLKTMAGNDAFPVALLDAKDFPFFGEAALLQNDVRSATIRCETACRCLVIQRSGFEAFCQQHPKWALPVVQRIGCVILERLHRANTDVALLYNALVSEVKGWNG